jgi:hypothetical protein
MCDLAITFMGTYVIGEGKMKNEFLNIKLRFVVENIQIASYTSFMIWN